MLPWTDSRLFCRAWSHGWLGEVEKLQWIHGISQKRWLPILPPLLNRSVTSAQPFHPSWALTLLFTYHALLIALKAVIKGATWLQAVTDDLCHVLNALAFYSERQPCASHPLPTPHPSLHPHSIAWQLGECCTLVLQQFHQLSGIVNR